MNVQFRDRPEEGSTDRSSRRSPIATSIRSAKDPKALPLSGEALARSPRSLRRHVYQGMMVGPLYPKGQPNASRRDAVPPEGGVQGSSLKFMQQQHLDPNNVSLGMLNPLGATGQGQRRSRPGGGADECHQRVADRRNGLSKDKRLKASVVVANEDGLASAAKSASRAGDQNFVQVLLLTRNVEPLGQRRYWPIYQAAHEAGLPIGIHAFGFGGSAMTASGWPSYHIEEMVGHAQCQQAALTSLVLEGVFERFPTLNW